MNGPSELVPQMMQVEIPARCPLEATMETSVRKLFERYEGISGASLHDGVDMDDVATLYIPEFIAASPAGVMTGKNDEHFKQVVAQGYAHYRAIGTKITPTRWSQAASK